MIKVNGKVVDIKKFPNNESLISSIEIRSGSNIQVDMKFESNEDIMNLVFIKKHLDEINIIGARINLFIPYLPYSRMDRTESQNVFTLKYLCEIINWLGFNSVETCEAHSNVSLALINKLSNIHTTEEIVNKMLYYQKLERDGYYLFYPDEGAMKRYSKNIKYDKVLCGSKTRDFATGEITKFEVIGDIPSEPFNVIIVDDLCSKGGTFMASAKSLKEIGAEDIRLVVTHCEKTILDGDVLKTDLISSIETTNSIISNEDVPSEYREKIFIREII